MKELVNKGYKEVTLLGQNVNSYGKDLGCSFVELLKEVSDTGIERLKFVTSNPWDFKLENYWFNGWKKKLLFQYIHLPVQSGSNSVLKTYGKKVY